MRLHAEPYPSFFLDMADEMGVCVLDETAIWGSDTAHKYDTPDFWTRCNDDMTRLVLRDAKPFCPCSAGASGMK